MKKKQVLWIKLITGLLVVLVLVSLGYFSKQYFKPDTVGAPTPTPTAPTTAPFKSLFQDLIFENCKTLKGSYEGEIEGNLVPISINYNKLKNLGTMRQETFGCSGYYGKGTYYVSINLGSIPNQGPGVFLYDDGSDQVPTEYSFFRLRHGEIIKDDGILRIALFPTPLRLPILVGEISVDLRGEKKIILPNGEVIYASYHQSNAIPASDNRLVNLLNQYSEPNEYEGKRELIIDARKIIKDAFFSDLSKLGLSEKKALDEIELVLGAISAK